MRWIARLAAASVIVAVLAGCQGDLLANRGRTASRAESSSNGVLGFARDAVPDNVMFHNPTSASASTPAGFPVP